jgi:hypothetical protein
MNVRFKGLYSRGLRSELAAFDINCSILDSKRAPIFFLTLTFFIFILCSSFTHVRIHLCSRFSCRMASGGLYIAGRPVLISGGRSGRSEKSVRLVRLPIFNVR